MPWFAPPPLTVDEESAYIQPGGSGIPHKVGRWPHPNTDRTDSRFILLHMDPLSHVAYRRLFCVECTGTSDPVLFPEWRLFGHQDMAVEAVGHLKQSVPANVDGWDLITQIRSFDALPVSGNPGIEFKLTLTHAVSSHQAITSYEFDLASLPFQWNTIGANVVLIKASDLRTPAFPYDFVKFFDWPMSDCFEFVRETPPPLFFAAFNAVDTSIVFDQFTNFTEPRYQLEFDARFRDFSTCALLARTDNTVSWVNINRGGVAWKQFNINFSPFLVNNVWYRIRLEYNWNDPGTGRKLYLDGVLNAHLPASGNVSLTFDLMGKKGPTYIGDFDCKNLTLLDTDPAAARVVLDMPLLANACDVGELSIKGTTENMSLPSCP